MPGDDKQIQNQNQFQVGQQASTSKTSQDVNNETGPWAPAKSYLTKLLESFGSVNPSVTPQQTAAADTLTAGASAIPNFGGEAASAASKLFGADTTDQVGMLKKALSDYQSNIGGTASGAELDPNATPGFAEALKTMGEDITNQVKGVYSASGRDPSGAGSFAGSLARGLAKGEAPAIVDQYNRNKAAQMDAAAKLFGGAGGTASAITGQEQVPLANAAQAVGLLPQVTSSFTAPGTAQMSVADLIKNLPISNISNILAPLLQAGKAGSTTTGTTTGSADTSGVTQQIGTGHGETSQPQSLFSNILGGVTGAAGILSLLSDRRMKTDVKEIGRLHDGQRVMRFRYKGEPRTNIGLIAQDVEKRVPDAVHEIGGLKHVDLDRATRGAVREAA